MNAVDQQDRLRHLRALARTLDSAIKIPGFNVRVGLDSLLGLLPVVGDAIGAFLSAYIVFSASRLGVPRPVLARMYLNVAVDALLGAIPLLGDVFDVAWRANTRNVALLERALAAPRATARASVAVLVGAGLAVLLVTAGAAALVVTLVAGLFHG